MTDKLSFLKGEIIKSAMKAEFWKGINIGLVVGMIIGMLLFVWW